MIFSIKDNSNWISYITNLIGRPASLNNPNQIYLDTFIRITNAYDSIIDISMSDYFDNL